MKRPIRYAGTKWRVMPSVLPYIPDHHCSIEAFVGSAAFTLSKGPSPVEIINDTNEVLVNFWRVVKWQGEELARQMELTPLSRAVFNECIELLWHKEHVQTLVDEGKQSGKGNMELAVAWCTKAWQAIATVNRSKRWTVSDGLRRTTAPSEIAKRIRDATKRLECVYLENVDGLELIQRYRSNPDNVIFCDPPYLPSICSENMYAKNADETLHYDLLKLLIDKETKAKIIISSYPNVLYEETLKDWSFFDVETSCMATFNKVSLKEERNKRIERFWYNYTIESRQSSFF